VITVKIYLVNLISLFDLYSFLSLIDCICASLLW